MADTRRLDDLEKVVRDSARSIDDLAGTVLARLGTHTHTGDSVGSARAVILGTDDAGNNVSEPIGTGSDEFSFAVSANAKYIVEAFIIYTVSNLLFLQFTQPSGASVVWSPWGPDSAATASVAQVDMGITTVSLTGNNGVSQVTARPTGSVITGGTGGTVTLNFRSSSGSMTVHAGSWIRLTRVS